MIDPKKSIQKLTPYVDGNHSEFLIKNHTKILKLDSNEPTSTPSKKVSQAIVDYLNNAPINWYPDVKSAELRRRLSEYTQLPTECILTFNGSDHALECVARTFLDTDDQVIIFQPTYDHFRVYAESCDAQTIYVDESLPCSLTDKIKSANAQRLRMVYLVNPNNPTGTFIQQDEITTALKNYPNVVFILDEAYYEFCGITMASLVNQYNNIVVTRSFSKAFGLASLRCGYILAHPTLCEGISKIRIGKNVNALAQVAAVAALEDVDAMFSYVEEVKMAKNWTIKQLASKNITVIDTSANFILFKVKDPDNVVDYLEQKNIYLRNRSMMPNLKGYIRLTIGNRDTMKVFWDVFETVPERFV